MDDVARGEEEERLEERVGHEVEDARHLGADRHGEEHVADLAHRGVGQHALDVGLHGGDEACHHGGAGADEGCRARSRRGLCEQGMEAGEQVDAGRHHGGGVDQGRHRGRALHGVRQPGVEGQLGRLGHGAHQQQERDQLRWPARHRVREEVVEAQAAGRLEGDEGCEHDAHVADHVHHERLLGSGDRRWALVPEPDQEVA